MSAELSMAFEANQSMLKDAPVTSEKSELNLDEALELRKESFLRSRNPLTRMRETIYRVGQSYRRWRFLQSEIRRFPTEVEQNWRKLEVHLTDYRLCIAGLTYKAVRVDNDIWDLYLTVLAEKNQLADSQDRYPLFLHRNPWLEERYSQWNHFYANQARLLRLIERAPGSHEFYNKMQLTRAERRAERSRAAEEASRITEARASLLSAIDGVKQLYDEERLAYTSRLLSLEDAERYWEERLKELEEDGQNHTSTVEDIIQEIISLENLVRTSPKLIQRIRDVEERLTRIISTHDLLLANGKSIIPHKEMVRISSKLYELVPKQWASGQLAELEHTLETLENFLSSYENSVEMELSFLERRRPGLARVLNGSNEDNGQLLPQITTLARSMVNAIDARDRFMRGHSENVARISAQIGQKLQWPQADLDYLYAAAMLHDVGKLSIPETILAKPGALTPEEWRIIHMHPYFGAQIIKPIDILARIVPWVYHHHERWDGSGYPDRLLKHETPTGASIIALAEAYSVMVCEQPTRPAMSKEEAIEIVRQNSGTQFCPEVVNAFLDIDHP